jgi:predicted transposase YbfD/YdcC
MDRYDSPLHIISAHLAELGITIGQRTVAGKSNEIPAMRELIGLLTIEGCMVVADALNCQKETAKAACIGAINTQFTSKKGESDEWHYYISSRRLTAEELLRHARLEWSVETMHWLLDVHFGEDFCRVEDRNVQQNMNSVRKIALNTIKGYKNRTASKRPISRLMFDCLLESENILSFLTVNEN